MTLWDRLPSFHDTIGGLIALVGVGVISYVAVTATGDIRSASIGLIGGIVVASNNFYLRGRYVPPDVKTGTTTVVDLVPHG